MTKTVASAYIETAFYYTKTVREWYKALKQQVSTDEFTIKEDIRNMYRRAIKPLSKAPKDFELWITTWEQIIAKGSERNLLFANTVDEWFRDFLKAVDHVHPI